MIVLLHGFLASRTVWRHVAPVLAERATVVTVDLRGHGASGRTSRSGYTIDALVADAVGWIEQEATSPVDLVGHSLGGVTAMRVAIERPNLVRSLVVVDSSPAPTSPPPRWLGPLVGLLPPAARAGLVGVLARVLARRLPPPPAGSVPAAERLDALRTDLRRLDGAAFRGFLAELGRYDDLTPGLRTLGVPTSVIVGERDDGLRDAADRLAATVPGAELTVIAGGSHSPFDDDPAAWLAAVARHLDRVAR